MEGISITTLLVSIIGLMMAICVAVATYFVKRSFDTIADVPVKLANITSAIERVEDRNKAAYRELDNKIQERFTAISQRVESLEAKAANQYPPNQTRK